MIDSSVAFHFVGQDLPLKPKPWRKKITGNELVQEVVAFISEVLGVNEAQARIIFCWCLHTRYWWEFKYSPRLIFQSVPKDIDTSALMSILSMFCGHFPVESRYFESSAPLAIGDIFNPIMLIEYDKLCKNYRQQIDCIIETGYKEYGHIASGLCSYECFYPLSMVTKQSINDNIESKIIIPLFYDISQISDEMFDRANLLKAKINAFLGKIDFYSVGDKSESTNSIIRSWQPIYRIAQLISPSFYKQIVKDTLKIAYEATEQA